MSAKYLTHTQLNSITVDEPLFIEIMKDFSYENKGNLIAIKNIDKFSLIKILSRYSSVDYKTYLNLECLRIFSEINIPSLRDKVFNNALNLKKDKYRVVLVFLDDDSFSHFTCKLSSIDTIIDFKKGKFIIEKYK